MIGIGIGIGIAGVQMSGVSGLTFLLRDDFTTAASAPLTSPRTAEPTGTWTITDTENKASITGGELLLNGGKATLSEIDPVLISESLSRSAGLALLTIARASSGRINRVGFSEVANLTLGNVAQYQYSFGDAKVLVAASTAIVTETVDYSVNQIIGVILRAAGALYVRRKSGTWVLDHVSIAGNGATVYAGLSNFDGVMYVATSRALQLAAPYTTDTGLSLASLLGARSVGDTLTHEGNGSLYLDSLTLPSAGVIRVAFRWQDDNNCWIYEVTSTGAASLIEKVAGVETQRATAAAVVANGHRAGLIFDAAVIRGYNADVLRWTYSSATNFQVNTTAKILDLGTGGAINGANTWPRQITGTAASLLDSALA